MTQQYIRGEFSLLLGSLCDEGSVALHTLVDLRRRVERAPMYMLPDLAVEAMDIVDAACWVSLAQGDLTEFERESKEAVTVHEFATCAGLLP